MARIPIYSPQESAQPPNIGRDSGAGGQILGNAISSFGDTLGKLGDKIERHDTMVEESQFSASAYSVDTAAKQTWKDWLQNADPNDPNYHNLATKFMAEVYDPSVQALGKDLRTEGAQRHYEVTAAKMRAEMAQITASDQAHITGVAVAQNATTSQNAISTGVATDPTTFESSLDKAHDERLRIQRAGLPVDKALEWESETNAKSAVAAVRSMAVDGNYDKAKADLVKGRFDNYLNGEQKTALEKFVEDQKQAHEADARRAKADARRDMLEGSQDRRNKIMEGYSDQKGGIRIPKGAISKILADPSMTPEDKDALIGITKRLGEPDAGAGEMKTNPQTFIGLFNRIHAADGDPKKINNEDDLNQYLGNGLNYTSFQQLRAEVQGKRSEDGSVEGQIKKSAVDTAKRLLTGTDPLLGLRDPKGDENYQRFIGEFLPAYEKAKQSGENMNDFLSMDGFVGGLVKKYQRTPAQMMQDMVSIAAGLDDKTGAAAPVARPKTPEEAQKLTPGTHYLTPAGKPMVR